MEWEEEGKKTCFSFKSCCIIVGGEICNYQLNKFFSRMICKFDDICKTARKFLFQNFPRLLKSIRWIADKSFVNFN